MAAEENSKKTVLAMAMECEFEKMVDQKTGRPTITD
jgi:hypothetical protein